MSDALFPPRSFGPGTVSRDAASSLAYMGVVRGATLGLSVAVARLIGSSGAGAFGIALQVVGLGAMVACSNLPQALAKRLAENDDPSQHRALLRMAAALTLGIGSVAGLALMLGSAWIGTRFYQDASLGSVLFWCGPLVVATAFSQLVEGALQGLRRFVRLARWGAGVSALDLGLGIASMAWGVAGILVSRTLIRAGATVFAVGRWYRSATRPHDGAGAATARRSPAVAGRLLGYAWPALLSVLVVLIGQVVLRALLVRRSGLESAGHLQVADSLAQGLLLIPMAAGTALVPAVSRDQESGSPELPGLLRRAIERVAGFQAGLCLALIGLVPWVVVPLFGRDFGPARPALVLLSAAYGIAGPGLILGAVMLGRGEVWKGLAVNAVWVAVILSAFWFATSRFGASGAALAILLGHVVLIGVCLAWPVRLWSVPLGSILTPLFASATGVGLGCACALSPRVPAYLTALVCAALGAALFRRWGWTALAGDRPGRLRP